MSEEIEYPSKERERAKVNVKVSAEVNTYLHDLYNQIQYEFCEQYEDEIKHLQQKVEQLEKELQITANKCKQLENIRKEAIKYIEKEIKNMPLNGCKQRLIDLLNILNKGDNNGK